jgi:hypothetical protein
LKSKTEGLSGAAPWSRPGRALGALRRPISAGDHDAESPGRDPDLQSLRSPAEFAALILDAGFPDDPFARGGKR